MDDGVIELGLLIGNRVHFDLSAGSNRHHFRIFDRFVLKYCESANCDETDLEKLKAEYDAALLHEDVLKKDGIIKVGKKYFLVEEMFENYRSDWEKNSKYQAIKYLDLPDSGAKNTVYDRANDVFFRIDCF